MDSPVEASEVDMAGKDNVREHNSIPLAGSALLINTGYTEERRWRVSSV